MSSVIKLVKGDTRPVITLTLTDQSTNLPLDLSAPTTTVQVVFRQQGTTQILSTLSCNKTNGGADGVVNFKFTGSALNVPAGLYEGEIEINYNGEIQTVYDVLKFKVRDDF